MRDTVAQTPSESTGLADDQVLAKHEWKEVNDLRGKSTAIERRADVWQAGFSHSATSGCRRKTRLPLTVRSGRIILLSWHVPGRRRPPSRWIPRTIGCSPVPPANTACRVRSSSDSTSPLYSSNTADIPNQSVGRTFTYWRTTGRNSFCLCAPACEACHNRLAPCFTIVGDDRIAIYLSRIEYLRKRSHAHRDWKALIEFEVPRHVAIQGAEDG